MLGTIVICYGKWDPADFERLASDLNHRSTSQEPALAAGYKIIWLADKDDIRKCAKYVDCIISFGGSLIYLRRGKLLLRVQNKVLGPLRIMLVYVLVWLHSFTQDDTTKVTTYSFLDRSWFERIIVNEIVIDSNDNKLREDLKLLPVSIEKIDLPSGSVISIKHDEAMGMKNAVRYAIELFSSNSDSYRIEILPGSKGGPVPPYLSTLHSPDWTNP